MFHVGCAPIRRNDLESVKQSSEDTGGTAQQQLVAVARLQTAQSARISRRLLFRPEPGGQHSSQFIGGHAEQDDRANDGELQLVRNL